VMIGVGGEAEARVAIVASAWLFARFAGLGVINGASYNVAGASLLDTSRLELAGSIGAGVGLP